MYKKLFTTLLLIGGLCFSAWADTVQTITFNGETVEKTATQLTFSGDKVTLTFNDGSSQAFDMEGLAIAFSNKSGNDTATNLLEVFSYNKVVGNQLIVGNVEGKTPITIYDTAGRRVLTSVAEGSSTQIDLSGLKNGIYLLRAGKQAVKFVKR